MADIIVKQVTREITITQVGRRGETGPQGPQGDPATNIVTSVQGRIGDVVITKADVGLSNVDNTSDINKPISSATSSALDLKADDNTVVHKTGDETIGGVKSFVSSPLVPSPTQGTQAVNKDYVDTAGGSYQPLDPTLTALASFNTNGLLTQTSENTFTGRNIVGTANQVIVVNGSGVDGNPTLSLPQSINTGASPTFAGATLNGVTTITHGSLTPLVVSTGNPISINLTHTAASSSTSGAGIVALSNDGAALANGDRLGYMLFGGNYDASNSYNSAGMSVFAAEAWSVTNRGSFIAFEHTLPATNSRRQSVRVGDLTSINSMLYINASTADASSYALRVTNSGSGIFSGSQLLNIRNDGKIIIGQTTSPSGQVHIKALVESDTALLGGASGADSNATLNIAPSDNIVRWGFRLGTGATYPLSLDYRDSASGNTATLLTLQRDGQIGVKTTATHTLTIGSTANGIAYYNTTDQTTNFERARAFWVSSIFSIRTEAGGAGSGRALRLGTANSLLDINEAALSTGILNFSRSSGVAGVSIAGITGTQTQSSGVTTGLLINPSFSQSGTAGYTALLVNPTETSVGSGSKLLADFQVGGVSKAKIDNSGFITSPRLVLNSTSYLDGSVNGTTNIGSGNLGILATSGTATHSLTLGSAATGIVSYNTSDQTVNYERALVNWSSNIFNIAVDKLGSGVVRALRMSSGARRINLHDSSGSTTAVSIYSTTQLGLQPVLSIGDGSLGGSYITSSGNVGVVQIIPTMAQSGSAGYTALLVNTTETSVGSGTKLLADFQVGGVTKFSISNTGKLNIATSTAPASPSNGDVWFDGTDIKIRVGGVTKTFSLV